MNRDVYLTRYRQIRAATVRLAAPLALEDQVVQTMPDASPTKWHLAHTTWFFETFALRRALPSYVPVDARYEQLWNSYYNAVGAQFPRARRGALSRPTVAEVSHYRARVDEGMETLLRTADDGALSELALVLEVGLQHEQQHQELVLSDVKTVLAENPLAPAYRSDLVQRGGEPGPMRFVPHGGGVVAIGHGGAQFAFDNESPRHELLLQPFALGSRLVTAGEYAEFVNDGGYQRPELWLSDGWDEKRRAGWELPHYWRPVDGAFHVATLGGLRPLAPYEPVAHVSFYEADAYARWAGARLPLEAEWEVFAEAAPQEGNFVETDALHPLALAGAGAGAGESQVDQLFGDVWEWTASPYVAYPGYRPFGGALGEYNGKFMCNQLVLRGGSAFTPRSHIRSTYRNFFPPGARWQMTGIRLAR
jgi:ergothioneine biosynthesis protein EgtB